MEIDDDLDQQHSVRLCSLFMLFQDELRRCSSSSMIVLGGRLSMTQKQECIYQLTAYRGN